MPTCKNCNNHFSSVLTIDGKRHRLDHRVYCLECSPFKSGNTRTFSEEFKDTYKKQKRDKRYYLGYYYLKKKLRKQELIEYKGGKCEKCGYNKCTRALCFHHIDPSTKEFELSSEYIWKVSRERMFKEADKCQMLCANCHAELHEEESQSRSSLIG
jgi:hypothetical protein